jgi:hypothetical protein
MNKFYTRLSATALAALVVAAPAAAQERSRFGVDASEWDSGTIAVPGVIIPVGGGGQVNGGFVTGERYGVQIGIRAQLRYLGLLPMTREKQTGVYQASAGVSDGLGRATWNYDLHIDLRSAQGVAAGRTLGDYTLVLNSDIGPSIFGCLFPCDLADLGLPATVELFQTSQNPKFGNLPFNANAVDSYYFTLTLTPKTFNGPPITARMRVEVNP